MSLPSLSINGLKSLTLNEWNCYYTADISLSPFYNSEYKKP